MPDTPATDDNRVPAQDAPSSDTPVPGGSNPAVAQLRVDPHGTALGDFLGAEAELRRRGWRRRRHRPWVRHAPQLGVSA